MNKWLSAAQDWLLPRYCLLCLGAARSLDLCPGCRAGLPRIENPCRCCGVPLDSGSCCARCLEAPPPFDQVSIPFLYAGPLIALIHALKFRQQLCAAAVLGTLLADHLQQAGGSLPRLVLPVPLHPRRQRSRGFNQSMEIARALSARFELKLAPDLARRIRDTAAQSSLKGAAMRRRNLRGAFAAERVRCAAISHVAIVDDVVTTGATVIALAHTLRRAGVRRIDLWSVARAVDA